MMDYLPSNITVKIKWYLQELFLQLVYAKLYTIFIQKNLTLLSLLIRISPICIFIQPFLYVSLNTYTHIWLINSLYMSLFELRFKYNKNSAKCRTKFQHFGELKGIFIFILKYSMLLCFAVVYLGLIV
jgi:hypothetical protein